MRTITENDYHEPVNVQVPDSLAEVASFIDSKPADDEVEMFNNNECLGAQLLQHYNDGASVSFGYTGGRVRVAGAVGAEIVFDGAVWGFFDYLFKRGGINEVRVEHEISVPAYTCPCGNPDCSGSTAAHTETVRVTTFGGLRTALATYESLGDVDEQEAEDIAQRYRSDHPIADENADEDEDEDTGEGPSEGEFAD